MPINEEEMVSKQQRSERYFKQQSMEAALISFQEQISTEFRGGATGINSHGMVEMVDCESQIVESRTALEVVRNRETTDIVGEDGLF